jgi:hypothetical protein
MFAIPQKGARHDCRERAESNMPTTPQAVEAAARYLSSQGFSGHAVAPILKVDVISIRRMFSERANCE